MIAHIRSGVVIRRYSESKGRINLENGDTVSPLVAGYVNGNDRIVPVVEVTVDNSTGTYTRSAMVETVESDRVLRTVTISDTPIADKREETSITRGAFCLGLVGAKILPAAEAIDAAKGGWPATFAKALSDLSDTEKVGAQIEWATAKSIRRNHPLIAMLAAAARLSDAQVDALFGIV